MPPSQVKDVAMRTGEDGAKQSALIETLQRRTEENKEKNARIVEQRTFEANQPGYLGPFSRQVLIQGFGDEGSESASKFTLLDTAAAMRLKKAGYIEGKKFVKPVDDDTIAKYSEEPEGVGVIVTIGRVVTAPFRAVGDAVGGLFN